MNIFFIILIAILPAIALMIYIYLQDNHEREPIGLLMAVFGLGILSCLPSALFEWIATYVLDATFGGLNVYVYYFIYAIFGVAIFEEYFKYLAARLLTWRNRHFNYKFDGIVYCLFGSMGFAATENILYLMTENWLTGNQSDVIKLGIQRGLLAIPLHAMCAIFMGYYYGNAKYAKSYGNKSGCRTNLLIGFTIAVLLHGFYDACLFIHEATGDDNMYYLFLVFVVIADIFTFIRIHLAKKQNQEMYIEPKYKGYWIGPQANPYQPFGGQQAPSYGGYNYDSTVNPQASPYMQGQYNPEVQYSQQGQFSSQSQYAPQGQYNPQGQYTPQGQSVDIYGRPAAPIIAPNNFRNQMVRCPNCGATNRFNAFFCSGCGSSLHKL